MAGAGKSDLLDDLRRAIDKAAAHGTGLGEFRKDFAQIVFNRGWTGFTGDGTKAGIAWRTKVIYQTNMATSYAAGRWQQINHPDLLKLRPYWRYHHADGVMHPRPLHLAWNGLTLPHDHPFWKTYFEPNGWGCHCYITAVDGAEYAKAQAAGKGVPPAGWNALGTKTGTPVGIDKGFDYAPGTNVQTQFKEMIARKLIKLSPDIAKALQAEIVPVLGSAIKSADNAGMRPRNYLTQEAVAAFYAKAIKNRAIEAKRPIGRLNDAGAISATLGREVNVDEIVLQSSYLVHIHDYHAEGGIRNDKHPFEPADLLLAIDVINGDTNPENDGKKSHTGNPLLKFSQVIGGVTYKVIGEIREGRKNRNVAVFNLYKR